MAEDTPQQDRTEAATPRRMQRAREEGRVPVSREVQQLRRAGGGDAGGGLAAGTTAQGLAARLTMFLAHTDAPGLAGAGALRLAGSAALRGMPRRLSWRRWLAGSAASLLQTGFLINGKALQPDFSRISPARRPETAVRAGQPGGGGEIGRQGGGDGFILWRVLQADLPALMQAPRWEPQVLLARTMPPVLHMLFVVLAVQAAIAALDLFWVRLRHAQQLRMSKEDVREEQRETEGDPKIKARIKQIRMQRARRRMLAAVPKATVVVTNPTHYAVALAYDRARNAAPRVVAKGVDSLAARIREVAEANKVPLVANPPLAQALYRVEVDTEIPAEHYQAVAEIIAYVWRLGQRQQRTRRVA